MPDARLVTLPTHSIRLGDTHHRMIEGDNLAVMHTLMPSLAGTVKLIYIDPPYNTGKNFTYGDRRGEAWVEMMKPRLEAAHELLSASGAIVIHIDEHEQARLTTMLDGIFGRDNRLGTIVWDKGNPKGDANAIAKFGPLAVCCSASTIFFMIHESC